MFNRHSKLPIVITVMYLFVTSLFLLSFSSLLMAESDLDEIRNEFKKSLDHDSFSALYGSLIAFENEPDIAGSTFNIDGGKNTVLDEYKIPMKFKLFSSNGSDFYARIGLNYAKFKTDDLLNESISHNHIRSKWTTYGGTFGFVAEVPLNDDFKLVLAFDGGVSRVENDSSYHGVIAKEFEPIVKGILLDWSTNASIVSGVVGIKYQKIFDTIELDLNTHYTHSYVSSFSESSDFDYFSEHTDTFSAIGNITHPWNTKFMSYPLSGIIHLGYTSFLKNNRDAIGFSQYGALGYSIKFDISHKNIPVKSFNLGVKGIVGDNNLTGWSILFGYRF
ncbi:MAG: hypothetical protein KAI02_07310 [Gammaproteobacteria bacterium]|nr:hypothetical protein [Gammaproteobacteria bacterium]